MRLLKFFNTINEAKQVGILYHYTSVAQAIGILRDNALIGNPSKDVEGNPSTVSFTRNQNYHNTVEFKPTGGSARLAFDGDRMSNQFKLSPVMGSVGRQGWPMGPMGRPNNETEVIAFADSIPVKPYLVAIDVNTDEVSWSSFIDNFVAQAKEDYGITVGTIKNNRNVSFVDLSGNVSTAQQNWDKMGLQGQKGMDLSSLVSEAADGWITAYHGGADFEGGFSLGHQGSGENNLILGPGVYFADNPDIAKRYTKYAGNPAMYSVEINMSNIYDPVRGEPQNMRGIGDKMAQALGFQSVDDMPSAPSTFTYGKWPVGNIVKYLGRGKALAFFREFGLDGLYEILPDGTREIAVYNPAVIRNKQKITESSMDDIIEVAAHTALTELTKEFMSGNSESVVTMFKQDTYGDPYVKWDEMIVKNDELGITDPDKAFEKWVGMYADLRIVDAKEILQASLRRDNSGRIIVYREITEHDDWPENMHLRGLGEYWSWEKASAEAHWAENAPIHWVITASVDPGDVDWAHTIFQNAHIDYEEEREIYIPEGTEMMVLDVETDNKSIDPSRYPKGQMLNAGKGMM